MTGSLYLHRWQISPYWGEKKPCLLLFQREQITNLIQAVRDNHGGLKGIPMRDIISEIHDIARQRGLGMRSLSASKRPAEKAVAAAVVQKAPTHVGGTLFTLLLKLI